MRLTAWVLIVAGVATCVSLSTNAGLGIGDSAADFNLLSQFNTYYRLSDYQNYVVVIDFSVMNCHDCRTEATDLQQEMWEPYQDRNVMVFGLLSQNESGRTPTLEDLNTWASTLQLTYPVLQELGETEPVYGVTAFPTTFIVGRDMRIRYVSTGYNHDQLLAAFLATLNEDTPTPTESVTPTFTPSGVPTETPPTVTPTPTPDPSALVAMTFHLSDDYFQEGDTFHLRAELINEHEGLAVDFYAALDVLGWYYFYPAWTDQLHGERSFIEPGTTWVEVLGPFIWPYVEGELRNLYFYGLLTQPDNFSLASNVAVAAFGYGQ